MTIGQGALDYITLKNIIFIFKQETEKMFAEYNL